VNAAEEQAVPRREMAGRDAMEAARPSWWRTVALRRWLAIMGARPLQLLVPVLMSAVVATLEGVSLGLMVPIVMGVTRHDFGFVRDIAGFSLVANHLPGWFGADDFAALFILVSSAAFGAAVLKNLLAYAAHVLSARWTGRYLRRATDYVFSRYLSFGKLYFDRAHQGSIQAVLGYTSDLLDIVNIVQRGILTLFLLLAHLAVMVWISWRLTAFVLCFFPVMHYAVRWMARRIERLSRQLNDATLTRHQTAYNLLSSVPLLRAYSQEAQARRSYSENNETLRRLNLRINIVQGLLRPFQEIIGLAVMLGTIAFLAFYLGDREPAELAVFLVFFYAARAAVPKFASLYEIRATVAARTPRLAELARLLDDDEKFIVADGHVEFSGLGESIEIRNLHFAYRDGLPVLKGLNVTISRGRVTALVGPSGAGKSTLIHLLMGFYAVAPGSIRVDGRDLGSLRMASLRRHIALVAQDVFLFNDTLRANLLVATDHRPSDAELWAALERARLADLVRALPEGLDTRVGDRGMKLSGGEQQRVAICRALLKRADILILDEATSALDTETERLIQEAMHELMHGRTAIVIAHRLSTVRHADQIVFLEAGRIVEQGRWSQLLERGGRFAAFWRAQEIPMSQRG
jgi:subfamily B ATP-binding cassette protein MsbA